MFLFIFVQIKINNMKIEQKYFRWVSAVLTAAILWGIISPILISSPTDIGVILGVIVAVIVPVLIYWIIRPIFKNKTNEKA